MEQIIIERVFDAPKELVWKAWTTPELAKKWWGPKDFTAPSMKIDFRVGGKYIFCMRGPQGSPFDKDMYSAGIFKEIVPMEKLVVSDYFSDENGEKISPISMGMPADFPDEMDITVLFETVEGNKTKLSLIYSPETASQKKAMLASGMQQGWATTLDKLAQLLQHS